MLAPLAWGFEAAILCRRAAYRRGWLKTQRLHRPVVSVGNLTLGGTGKTPLVAYLAERLLARGRRPSILTRGYRRHSRAELVMIEPAPGRAPDPRDTGDEAAWLARKLPEVPIVVCRDRTRAGRAAEQRFDVDLHLLDDGFQHWGLARALDIVLLDASEDYFAGLLPAGRLREPLSALARADLVVLTRTTAGPQDPKQTRKARPNRPAYPIEPMLARWAPQARVFRAETEWTGLVPVLGGTPPDDAILDAPVFAFCGLGNPKAFYEDVKRWGFHPLGFEAFPDHHQYTAGELRRLAERAKALGARALLTTEKDAMNLAPVEAHELPILACAIQTRIPEAEAFDEAVLCRLEDARVALR